MPDGYLKKQNKKIKKKKGTGDRGKVENMNKKKFTIYDKKRGEEAVDKLSRKASIFYCGTDPLSVYGYETSEEIRYAYDGCGMYKDNLTFDELQKEFEELNFEIMKNSIADNFNIDDFPIRSIVCNENTYNGRLVSDGDCWELLGDGKNYLYGFMIDEENSQITKMYFDIPEDRELDDDDNYREAVSCEEIEEL